MRWLAWISICLCMGCQLESRPLPLQVPEGCNPLASEHDCLLPYPSDFFIHDGALSPGENALRTFDGTEVLDPLSIHQPSAYSVGSQILALFPGGVDEASLIGPFDDFSQSLSDDSPTLLLDVETGERILHFAELDPRTSDPARQGLFIRPLQRLRNSARYLVAIRGLRRPTGEPVPPPEGFRRLRDGVATSVAALSPLAARYDTDIFAPIEAQGITRAELQLAWDFTTQPIEETTGDMLAVRRQTIDYFASHEPSIEVVSFEDNPAGNEEHTFRRLELLVTVPLFLEQPGPYGRLARDAQGDVTQNDTVQVPFTVWVPQSVANRPPGAPPARLMQFGHGFFGDRYEVDNFADRLADERQFIVVAADWWGMSEEDRGPVADTLAADPDNTMAFTDRLHQAMANFMAVTYAAQGPLAALPQMQIGPGQLFDASEIYYYGLSLGGILGGTYMGLTPSIEKGILGVSGVNFPFMMYRARPFLAFLAVLQLVTLDPLDQQKFSILTQTSFDRIDPLSYTQWVLDSPLPGGPSSRQILMQAAIGDAQVPNFASHLQARALGVPLLEPSNRPVVALPAAAGPLPSALVEFDFGVAEPLPGSIAIPPTEDNAGHEGVRRAASGIEQLHRFFQPGGQVEHTCEGTCDPD